MNQISYLNQIESGFFIQIEAEKLSRIRNGELNHIRNRKQPKHFDGDGGAQVR